MKQKDNYQPDFTAYVLGELDSVSASRVKCFIESSAEASAEYLRTRRTISALQEGADIPCHTLDDRQRETVLAMSRNPESIAKIIPFSGRHSRKPAFSSLVFKFAAAACLTMGSFILGLQMAHRSQAAASSQSRKAQAAAHPILDEPSHSIEAVTSSLPIQNYVAHEVTPLVVQEMPFEIKEMPVVSIPQTVEPSTVSMEKPAGPAHPSTSSLKSFVIATSQAQTAIVLQPGLFRPVKTTTREFAGITLVAPMIENFKPAVNAPVIPHKTESQPSLVIHSWKVEIASCPWDSTRRLMRFVAQIPVDQAAIESNDAEYRLVVKFDPAHVQGYRLVTEKHLPPSGNSNLATRFAWYEIIPARNYTATREKPASLGVMEIVQPVAVKENQSLRLLDRGLSWNEAREDFEFETAMIGFNLLLQGADNLGSLNYKLVLDLAEQSRGEDVHGERTKFIKTVEQAQTAAGL